MQNRMRIMVITMIINVVGLGLIGGSFCKTIKKNTGHTCLGIDVNNDTLKAALEAGAIDEAASDLGEADLTIVCLYPEATVDFIIKNADFFKKGSIVIDSCGIKKAIVDRVTPALTEKGVTFIGTHPMAGREFSGFEYSLDNLFNTASLIITPVSDTPEDKLALLKDFADEISFTKVVVTTPEEHDKIIAYTSQLAHVVSNAYIKSPTLTKQLGFSAGSFKDLTRVARLNEEMWTSLFMLNKEPLIFEIQEIIDNLEQYKKALEEGNSEELKELLKTGRIMKENSADMQ